MSCTMIILFFKNLCKIFSMKGRDVHLIEGEVHNIKITYPYDLRVAKALLDEEFEEVK